jgi:hypothetical protein
MVLGKEKAYNNFVSMSVSMSAAMMSWMIGRRQMPVPMSLGWP